MKRFLIVVALLLFASQAYALEWQDSPQIGQLFRDTGVTGTFVLYDVTARRITGHDQRRANMQFAPASTFKIFNTLVGLSIGAIESVDEILPYGGRPQPVKAWEKDMSLRDAIVLSNVAVYQELARRIGLERMRNELSRMNYGNGKVGTVVDDFWLVGPLAISAIEQTQLLAQLAEDALPFPKKQQAAVREIIRLEQKESYSLYGKTGLGNFPNPGLGWWVGWVQKEGRVYAFALNIDMQQASDAGKRIELGRACLRALGVF